MIVEVPNVGEIEFPDSMSPEQVSGVLKQRFSGSSLGQTGKNFEQVNTPSGPVSIDPTQISRPKPQTIPSLLKPAPRGSVGQQLLKPLVTVNNEMIDNAFSGGPVDKFVGGVGKGLFGLLSASTTPAFAPVPLIGKVPVIGPAALSTIGLGFGANMLGQTANDLSTKVTPSKLGEAAVNIPLGLLMASHGVSGLGEAARPRGTETLLSKDYKFPPVKVEDLHAMMTGEETIPTERRLGVPPVDATKTETPKPLQMARQPIIPPQQVEGPPSPVNKALPPGVTTSETLERNPTTPISGEQPPVVSTTMRPGGVLFVETVRTTAPGQFDGLVSQWEKQPGVNAIEGNAHGEARKRLFEKKGFTVVKQVGDTYVMRKDVTRGQAADLTELGKEVNRTPEEEDRYQELKAKSAEANKKMAGDWASQLKNKNQETKLYRGSPVPEEVPTPRHFGAAFFASKPEIAAQYGKHVAEYVQKGGEFLDSGSREARELAESFKKERYADDEHWQDVGFPEHYMFPSKEFVDFLQKKGYSGFKNGGDYAIFDPIKLEKKTSVVEKNPRTLMDSEAATLRHDYLPWLSPEQRAALVKEYTEGGDITAIEAKAQALRKQVIQDRITTEKKTNETKQTKEKGTAVQAPGVLPKQGIQPQGSGGTREGGRGSNGQGEKVQANAQDETVPKEEVLGGIGKGINAALDKNKNDESGMVDLRGVVDAVVQARKKLAASLATRDNKKDIVRDKDVADNAAVILGQRARTGQESLSKVLFGPRSKEALNATTAAIEAKGDVKKLDDFIRIARAKNDQSGLNAATFAKNNWTKIQSLVKRAEAQHNMVFNAAKAEGVNVDYRTGYIRHLYDLSKLPQHYADLFFGESGGTGGKGFKKERTFDTLYDAIDAGYGKAIKSWNSAELLEHRLRRGFQEVNDLQWAKHFSTVKDPTTGSPVVSLTERPGYERWSPLGQSFYIHRGYGKVFEAAQGMSAIRKFEAGGLPIGDAMMKGLGTAKHSLLMFDSYHAMRMAAKSMSLTGDVGHRKGLALLEYNPGDLKAAVQAGDITQEMSDWANKNRDVANLGIKNGLNIGRVQEAIDSDIVRRLNVLGTGTANKWIFEKFTRGVMLESFVSEFNRVKKANPGMTEDAVAKKVARDLNFNFGNIGRQGVLRSATAQDMARMVFLAPQWFESMAQTEARSVGQMVKVPVTGKVGTLAKGTGTLLLAMFVATQVANMESKGHPTWDNPEGHKMDAWVPGTGEAKNGLYVSPFSLPMELTHDLIRYTAQGKSPLETVDKIVGNKLSPPMRAAHTLYEREDYAGRKLTDKQAVGQAGKDALPLPLLGQAYLNPSASFERQAMASAGLKGEPAESPRQRIQQLARKNNPQSVVYPVSQYAPLKNLIENGKIDEAKTEYQKLIKGKTEKEVANVEQYFKDLPDTIHTGSKEKEQAFYDGLSDENKRLYQEVRKENKDLSEKFFNDVLGHGPKMTRGKRKRFSAFTYENDN